MNYTIQDAMRQTHLSTTVPASGVARIERVPAAFGDGLDIPAPPL